MRFSEVVPRIFELSEAKTLTFPERAEAIHKDVIGCTFDQLREHLDYAGIIPECFDHDSTEEKLFAKYCDSLLAKTWTTLGIKSEVLPERADAADVAGTGDGYTIVGDAKAFRLSRTAKNQKDFKVEALNVWRKQADYACLVAPIYQYPNTNSQIYLQAVKYNVTLLSYTHLSFLVRFTKDKRISLKSLWTATKGLKQSKSAAEYWAPIDKAIFKITAKTLTEWEKTQKDEYLRLAQQAKEQIAFWEKEKDRIKKLPHEVAVRELIEALKIDAKIKVIASVVEGE